MGEGSDLRDTIKHLQCVVVLGSYLITRFVSIHLGDHCEKGNVIR